MLFRALFCSTTLHFSEVFLKAVEFMGFEAPQAIYKWQQGKSLPSTDNLFALSRSLGVTIEDILVAEKPKYRKAPQEQSCGPGFFGGKLPIPLFAAQSARWIAGVSARFARYRL